jgi:hypothetical protein
MGLDFTDVADFLEDKCIAEFNVELVIDYCKDPKYINPLNKK